MCGEGRNGRMVGGMGRLMWFLPIGWLDSEEMMVEYFYDYLALTLSPTFIFYSSINVHNNIEVGIYVPHVVSRSIEEIESHALSGHGMIDRWCVLKRIAVKDIVEELSPV